MTVTSKAVPSVHRYPNLNPAPIDSSEYDSDFPETRNRWSQRLAEAGKQFEIHRKTYKIAAPPMPSVRQIGRLEESL